MSHYKQESLMLKVNINNTDLQMEVDTGAMLSISVKKNIQEGMDHKKGWFQC